jgi:hypothetical protein
MPSEYENAHAEYRKLAKAALEGNEQARRDKSKAMQTIVAIEREAARAGTILNAVYKGEKIETIKEQTESKRSLQEEYCRKFDAEKKVVLSEGAAPTTLRDHHRARLLGK